ncbi:MAG: HD domain-containing phosphohydrolase [Motiliproteus sp.]
MNGDNPVLPHLTVFKELTVFEWLDLQHRLLSEIHQQLLDDPEKGQASRCLYLAHQIQKVASENPIGLLAALQLNRSLKYQQMKELFVGVLCEMLAKEQGLASSARLYLICAALTQDLGMLELQDNALDRQANPLTDSQKRQISKHPLQGMRLLQRAQVKETQWLTPLEQHHEQPDGRGYPSGLKGHEITLAAGILRVADGYVAMVRPRGDRPALLPKDAIKEIFLLRSKQFDTVSARILANILGLYPPGCWVRLYNGEMGVVSGIGNSHPFPVVSVILSTEGEHLSKALPRDTHLDPYTVVEMVKAPFHFSLTSLLNQIWPTVKVEMRKKV